jgi:hypothetical protein
MTWLRVGIACRTAIDIALHRVGLLAAAREGLPATMLKTIIRTWLLCFVVDRTLCAQLGKPSGSQWEWEATQYVEYLRNPAGDGKNSVQPTRDDIWVAALVVCRGTWPARLTAGMVVDPVPGHRGVPTAGLADLGVFGEPRLLK